MTSESIKRLTERFAAQLADKPEAQDDAILRSFVAAVAEDVAATLFLAIRNELDKVPIETTPLAERVAMADRLNTHIALVGIDLAIRVRRNVYPGGTEAPVTEIELLAGRAFQNRIDELLATVGAGGCA